MYKTNLFFIVGSVGCFLFLHSSTAGPLRSAEVTKIINRVSVIDPTKGGHSAAIQEVIKDDLGLQTGARSRSELLFQDNTLTRIGAETFFSFKTGTRDLTLEKGSMLLQVPKGLGGANIHTAAVTAAITGTTIMMEYVPRSYIKVLVLEGTLRLSRNGAFGDSLVLRPGKMVIMRPDAKKIPEPVDFNLEHLVKTSILVNLPGRAPLPSMPLIQAAIGEQKKQLAKGHLAPTNLVMHGANVIFASNDQLARITRSISSPGVNGESVAHLGGAVGSVTNTVTSGTTAVNNLVGSGGTVGQTTNNLLGGALSGTAVAVSNSTQILGLLNNVTSTAGGIVTITPPIANVVSTVTTVPATVLQQTTGGGTVNAAGALPIPNGAAANVPVVTNILNTGSALTTGVLPNQNAPTAQLLGGGH